MKLLEGRLAGDQIVGDRKRQEDDFGIIDLSTNGKECLLLILADGMGGHAGGAEASEVAVKRFIEYFETETGPIHARLSPALAAANLAVGECADENPEWEGMGCTLTAALITEEGLWWISVGDSPLYIIQDGKLVRLNDDHSMRSVLQDMVSLGRMTLEKAKSNPNRNALRSVVSGGAIKLVDAPTSPLPILPGDKIILASDGLDTLDDKALLAVVEGNENVDALTLVGKLLKSVTDRKKPHQDNTSVICYYVDRSSTDSNSKLTTATYGKLFEKLKIPRYSLLALVFATIVVFMLGFWSGKSPVSSEEEVPTAVSLDKTHVVISEDKREDVLSETVPAETANQTEAIINKEENEGSKP